MLITSLSICSFSLIAKHTFSVAFKSGERADQVVPKIFSFWDLVPSPLPWALLRVARSVMKFVEPTGRGRGWHVNHQIGSRSRPHAWVWGTKSPEAKYLTKLHNMLG